MTARGKSDGSRNVDEASPDSLIPSYFPVIYDKKGLLSKLIRRDYLVICEGQFEWIMFD